MYSLNMPVSQVRTKVRQEFERHRYVSQLPVVDMLLAQGHMEFQVSVDLFGKQEEVCKRNYWASKEEPIDHENDGKGGC